MEDSREAVPDPARLGTSELPEAGAACTGPADERQRRHAVMDWEESRERKPYQNILCGRKSVFS